MPRRKKSRAAWGALTKAGPDTWRLRFWATDADGKYRRKSCTIHGTRLDAERRRSELMLAHSEDAPCPTVGAVWTDHVVPDLGRKVADGDVSADTLTQYRRWWAKHVEPRWGAVQCDAVTPLAVQQWLYGLTRSQAQNALLVTRKAMDYAVRYGWCPTNPFRERYQMPSKATVSERDKGVWTLSELGEAWRRLHGSWMEPAFILSAFGSARVGESLAPLAKDVERREVDGVTVALVAVRDQVAHHGKALAGRTKTRESARVLVIVGRAAARLLAIAASLPPDCPLTSDGCGGHVSQARYTEGWRRLGMEHPYRNLRNSWQTWMRWELRVAPHFIEPMMGHRLPGTTGQHYDRPQADVFCEVMADAYRQRPYDADWDWVG